MNIDLELLSIQNPWWTSLGSRRNISKNLKSDLEFEISDNEKLRWQPEILTELSLKRGDISILRGARGTGKTTILKLLIKKLISKKDVNPDNIFYYSCHNLDTYEELNELIKIFLNWRKKTKQNFIFIDEIALIKNWPRGVDYLAKAGKLNNSAVILSSSTLPKKHKELDFVDQDKLISGLDFFEFIKLLNPKLSKKLNKNNYKKYQAQLDYYLDIYFLTGGFIVCLNDYLKQGAISQTIYNNYLYWLIADFAKLDRDIVLLRQILEQVIINLGQPVGYKTIARKTKTKSHLTVAEYLEILESMLSIKMVYQSDKAGKPTSRMAKKVYFRDPFLFWLFYSYIYGSVDSWQFSRARLHRQDVFNCLIENIVFSHLIKQETLNNWGQYITYWRDNIKKKEINFLVHKTKKTIPIIIDYEPGKKDAKEKIFKLAGFREGIIISHNTLGLKGSIKTMPLTYFLLFYKDLL